MLIELLTYRCSAAKCQFNVSYSIKLDATAASGVADLKFRLIYSGKSFSCQSWI
jgi:hypothetical protein